MKRKTRKDGDGVRFRSTAMATLSLLSIAAVAYLAIAALSGASGAVNLHAQGLPDIAAPARPTSPARPNTPSRPTSPASPAVPATIAPTATELRVATWNVRDCAAFDSATTSRVPLHEYVARTVKDARADVIVFEEIQSDEDKGGDIALLSVALAREGWAMPFVAVVNAKGEDDLAVFSRYKITNYGSVLNPGETEPWPRPGIFASIEAEGGALDIYGFHFKAMGDQKSEKARRAQAKALGLHLIASYGESLLTRAIVVAGDFNTANASDLLGSSSTISALRLADDADKSNDFLDANYGFRRDEPTFVDSRYSSVLDHILISPALAVGFNRNKVEVLHPVPGPGKIPTSDHNLVIVEILLAQAY